MRRGLLVAGGTLLLSIAVAGCAAGSISGVVGLLAAALLLLAGCSRSHGPGDDDIDSCDGTLETCCVDGMVDVCCCPPMTACNYGWFNDCGDGTCEAGRVAPGTMCTPEPPPPPPPPACEGTWETCCVGGMFDRCCCPAGAACNYGWGLQDCGGGTCVSGPGAECPAP